MMTLGVDVCLVALYISHEEVINSNIIISYPQISLWSPACVHAGAYGRTRESACDSEWVGAHACMCACVSCILVCACVCACAHAWKTCYIILPGVSLAYVWVCVHSWLIF